MFSPLSFSHSDRCRFWAQNKHCTCPKQTQRRCSSFVYREEQHRLSHGAIVASDRKPNELPSLSFGTMCAPMSPQPTCPPSTSIYATPGVKSVELAELLCDTLNDAPDSTCLRFQISPRWARSAVWHLATGGPTHTDQVPVRSVVSSWYAIYHIPPCLSR